MKKLTIYFLLLMQSLIAQKTNVQNELAVKNTHLFYFKHKIADRELHGYEYFKPYLAYIDDHEPQDYLMDSFILADFYYHKGNNYDGIYDKNYLDSYLKDLFFRTRLPIITTNREAEIGANQYSALSYTQNIQQSLPSPPLPSVYLGFNYKLNPGYIPTTNTNYDILIGWEFFDSQGNELYASGSGTYSDYFDIYYQYRDLTSNSMFLTQTINIPNSIRPNVASIKFHIMNFDIANNSKIWIDNVKLSRSASSPNLIIGGESNFDLNSYNEELTNWEFQKEFNTVNDQYLFKGRNPIIEEVNSARNSILESINLPPTKLIFTLPDFDIGHYVQEEQTTQLKELIDYFINQLWLRFKAWKDQNLDSKIDAFGVYMLDEDLNWQKADTLVESGVIEAIKSKLYSRKWQLVGSPFHIFDSNCNTNTSYDYDILNYFDILWQQPNAFFLNYPPENNPSGGLKDIDSDLLRQANKLMFDKKFNANIETNFFRDGDLLENYLSVDGYGRVTDYFRYGKKYGFINYSKLYFDEGGLHFRNANSTDEIERVDYDNLYNFIKESRRGVVINNDFETDSIGKAYRWKGNYELTNNFFSHNDARNFKASVNSTDVYSDMIPIEKAKNYNIRLRARKTLGNLEQNSALVGVIFYDRDGIELGNNNLDISPTNLTPSTALGNYYIYLNTTSTFKYFDVNFKAPESAVAFKFYLKKWMTTPLEFENISFAETDSPENFRQIYTNSSPVVLKIENEISLGTQSIKLGWYLQNAVTTEKISVLRGKDYKIKIWAKEQLQFPMPDAFESNRDKALIGIEAFNSSGLKIKPNLSSNFSYSEALKMHFVYIKDINQIWKEFDYDFKILDTKVESIKIHLYNWHYNGNIYLDNLSFGLLEEEEIVEIGKTNLFKENNWTEKQPLEVSYWQPVFYKDLIDVSTVSQLKFTAKMRDTYTEIESKDLIAIEFYDANYNLLTNSDILTSQTNFQWSSYYKYWWPKSTTATPSYFAINSWGCNSNSNDEWFNNQWSIHERYIDIPEVASFIRISLHKLSDSNEDFLILNPRLTIEEERNSQKTLFTDDQFALRN